MIDIQCLNKKDLAAFIVSKEFEEMPNLPISKHRAWSHIQNPRADEDDILLLLAYYEDSLVGYLGVLPDKIWHTYNFEKCGWLSCLWIDPEQRGKQIAYKLVSKAIEIWDKRILVTEFTQPAKRLYDKTQNFNSLTQNEGIRMYVRSNLNALLAPKKNIFRTLQPLFKIFDSGINLIWDLRFIFYPKNLSKYKIDSMNEIDEELSSFIENRQELQLFRRTAAELNWIIQNPWILSQDKNEESKRYYFSSVAKQFQFKALKIRNRKNKLIAFVILAQRDCNLKIPYCYGEDTNAIATVLNHYLVKWRIKTCTVFHKELVSKLRHGKTPALFKKSINRNYIISTHFDQLPTHFEIQDGDADCSFT